MTEDNYKRPQKGKLIAIEGIDGAGKTVQTQKLHLKLVTSIGGITWSFPNYANDTGKFIKEIMNGKISYHSHTWACLLAANRYEDMKYIQAALNWTNVVTNRYSPSNLVYSTASGINTIWLSNLDNQMPAPDLVVVLDINAACSFRRKDNPDLIERNLKYLTLVSETYRELGEIYGWKLIDGDRAPEDVHKDILETVNNRFGWNLSYD